MNLQEILSAFRYPNLAAEMSAGWCIDALARGAKVTAEIMDGVINGSEDMTMAEQLSLAKYIECSPQYLFAPRLAVLSRKNNRHKVWMQQLVNDLHTIMKYETLGSSAAHAYMCGSRKTNLVDLAACFKGGSPVTYASYRWVRQSTDMCLWDIRQENGQGIRKTSLHRDTVKQMS